MDQQLMPLSCLGLQRRRSCAELSGLGHHTETSPAGTNSTSMVCLNHNPQPLVECPSNVPAQPQHHYHHHHQHQYIYQLRHPDSHCTPNSPQKSSHPPEDLLQVMERRRHRINECRLMARSTVAPSTSTRSCAPPTETDGLTSSTLL